MAKLGGVLLVLSALLVTGCGTAVPSTSTQSVSEQRALALFKRWLRTRTTARETYTSDTVVRQPEQGHDSVQYSGVVDFRARVGDMTGYTVTESAARRTKVPLEQIHSGGDLYDRVAPDERSPWRWRHLRGLQWPETADDEKALTDVRPSGAVRIAGRSAQRFTGFVNPVTHRAIHGTPPPTCTWVMAIDLYVDERTGELVRYDSRMELPSSQPVSTKTRDSFTDFGVRMPRLTLPSPSDVAPDPLPGATVTLEATATPQDC